MSNVVEFEYHGNNTIYRITYVGNQRIEEPIHFDSADEAMKFYMENCNGF